MSQHAPDSQGPFKASYTVGGMTCATCSTLITQTLSNTDGLSNVVVNLLTHSLTLHAQESQDIEKATGLVEDLGYECTVVKFNNLKNQVYGDDLNVGEKQRTVKIKVEPASCIACTETIMAAFRTWEEKSLLKVSSTSTKSQVGLLEVSYVPNPPSFTIRDILALISSSSCHDHRTTIKASLYHPPTMESLSHAIQIRERTVLFWRSVTNIIIAIPTFIIGIVFTNLLPSTHHIRTYWESPILSGTTSRAIWALLFLATPVQFYCSYGFHHRAIKELAFLWSKKSKSPVWMRFVRFGSMNLLMSLGISVSYFSSIALLAMSSAASSADKEAGMGTTYFDSVVFLSMFLLIGRTLEAFTRAHTTDAIRSLTKIRPQTALLLEPQAEVSSTSSTSTREDSDLQLSSDWTKQMILRQVHLDELEIGDIVRVVPGGAPPSDGVVISSNSGSFDESILTGESLPVYKSCGDSVFSGTICKSGVIDIQVSKLGGETMLDRIVDVIREGQATRAAVERLGDTLASYFTPFVVFISLATWIIWLVLGVTGALPPDYLDISTGGWAIWSLRFAIAVFVIACPCGVGLAAPTALTVGSGLAAKFGILVRGGGEAFEEAAKVDIVCFDKTGTITEGGDLQVQDVLFVPNGALPYQKALSMVKSVESASSHPLARALVKYCDEQQICSIESTEFKETAGRGAKAMFGDRELVVGSELYLAENGVDLPDSVPVRINEWKLRGSSVVLASLRISGDAANPGNTEFILGFAISDALRQEALYTIKQLQHIGIATWMISGDNDVTCKAIARRAGIPEENVIAGVLPNEKADHVKRLQQCLGGDHTAGRLARVAMCGDGVNDAPALAVADVSIAMGSGSDLAVSTSSFILLSSNLQKILTLLDLSRAVMRRIKFNFAWAIGYNLIALPIAAGVIYPANHARLDPIWASLAMALSSISVLISSLLLKFYRSPAATKPEGS